MILVAGATGLLGREVCQALRARGAVVRALVRSSSPRRDELAALGVEIAAGDLRDPPGLGAACRGVGTVVTSANGQNRRVRGDNLATVDRDGQLALLEASRREGARRFVYVSASPNLRANCALIRIKRLVEREVRASGLEWVVLQPCAFLEIWLSPMLGWDLRRGRARIVGRGDRPVSFVAVSDVARVAAEAALGPELVRQDVPVGGPEALAPIDVLRLAEKIAGRKFRVQRVPLPVLQVVRAALSPFAPLPASLLSLGIQIAERGDRLDSSALWRRIGHAPLPVRLFLEKAVATPEPLRAQV